VPKQGLDLAAPPQPAYGFGFLGMEPSGQGGSQLKRNVLELWKSLGLDR